MFLRFPCALSFIEFWQCGTPSSAALIRSPSRPVKVSGFSAGLRPYLAGANGLLGVLLSQRVEVWQCVLVQLRHVIQHNLCPACDVEVLGCMAHLAE